MIENEKRIESIPLRTPNKCPQHFLNEQKRKQKFNKISIFDFSIAIEAHASCTQMAIQCPFRRKKNERGNSENTLRRRWRPKRQYNILSEELIYIFFSFFGKEASGSERQRLATRHGTWKNGFGVRRRRRRNISISDLWDRGVANSIIKVNDAGTERAWEAKSTAYPLPCSVCVNWVHTNAFSLSPFLSHRAPVICLFVADKILFKW